MYHWRWVAWHPFQDLGNIKIFPMEKLNTKLEKRSILGMYCMYVFVVVVCILLPCQAMVLVLFISVLLGPNIWEETESQRCIYFELCWRLRMVNAGAGRLGREGGPNISLLDICSGPKRSLAWSPRLPPGPGSVITWFRNQDSKLQKWGQHHFSKLSNERLSWF